MSYLTGATNSQSLNGILSLTDGIITIENGTISGLEEIDLNDLQVADTATIENLVVNNQIDMTSGQITNLANGTNANDAVNKSQLDLKADTTYVDGNFLNKTTTTTQSIAAKLSLTKATTDIFTNPIIQFINTSIAPLNQGQFIRFLKSVSQQANLEIGGLSFCANDYSNTLKRQADLICSMNSNTLPEINLKFNDGTINPLTINYGQFISRNNKQYFQKQDGTNIFNYIDTLDYVGFSKDISLGDNKIINLQNGSNGTDAVNKNQLDLKADTTYLDTNFLNKTTTTTQNIASRLSFDNTTSGSTHPIINLQNAITGSNKGMYLQMFKDFVREPDTEIGSIVFADKEAISQATNRAVQLSASIDSGSNPLFNITFDSGLYNPMTISNTQTILRTDAFYIKNKTTSEVVFSYLNSTDKFTMSKPLDMNTTNKITNVASPTDNGDVVNKQFLDTNFINKTTTSTQDVKGKLVFDDISQDIITFQNNLATASNGMRLLFKKNVTSHPFLYVGGFTWADLNSNGTVRRMVEMAVSNDGSTMPVFQMIMNTGTFTPVTINTTVTSLRNKEFYFINQQDSSNILTYLNSTNKIKMYKELDCTNISSTGNLSCVDLTTTGNQVCGTNSTNNLDVKSSTSFEADVLVKNNNHLMLGGNPTTTGGMRLIYDSAFQTNGTAYIDSRATSLIFRLNPTGNPTSNKVVISNNQTLVNSNFAVNGNTIIGNNSNSDTCTFNCQATFPTGSYINGARINLISKTSDFTLDYEVNFENGCICNHTSGTLNITMPNTGGDSGQYWRRRNYIIKVRETTVKLKRNTTTISTKIDELTGDVTYTTDYKTINLVFDENYHDNGQIWIISDR